MPAYVYLLQSKKNPAKKYIGHTSNLKTRLQEHNAGKSFHTAKYVPWELVAAVSFRDLQKAQNFERYLKSGSGHAFAKRHFW